MLYAVYSYERCFPVEKQNKRGEGVKNTGGDTMPI